MHKQVQNCCLHCSVLFLGTAAVAVGGILSSLRVSGMNLKDHKFLFFGAGGVSGHDFNSVSLFGCKIVYGMWKFYFCLPKPMSIMFFEQKFLLVS